MLRHATEADAAFILELLNEPDWLRYIGDRGVRTLADAESYITRGPVAMYARYGFGLYVVVRKADSVPVGICGLIQRENLPDVDLGYALLQRHWGQGYAQEAAATCLRQGREEFGLRRIVALTAPDNEASMRLLGKLGFVFERMILLGTTGSETRLFAYTVPSADMVAGAGRAPG